MLESGPKPKILVVEDLEVSAVIITRVLREFGCDVDLAENGQIAVDQVRTHSYDAIFMDVEMPVMDGLEATRQIRAMDPAESIQDLPILAFSARAEPEDQARCRDAGMSDFIKKSAGRGAIFATLKKWGVVTGEIEARPAADEVQVDPDMFDPEKLKVLSGMVAADKLRAVLAKTTEQLTESIETLRSNDIEREVLRRRLHQLVSVLGHFGFVGLSKQSATFEEVLRGSGDISRPDKEVFCRSIEKAARRLTDYCDQNL